VVRLQLPDYSANGGFPEPPEGASVHLVAARHPACGASTRIRLPGTLPTRAVRRLHCAGCGRDFDVLAVAEIGAEEAHATAPPRRPQPKPSRAAAPKPSRRPRLSFDPQGTRWKLLSVPIAASFVIIGLLALRGTDESPTPTAATAAKPNAEKPAEKHSGKPNGKGHERSRASKKDLKDAHLVAGVNYTLALPASWKRVDPPTGATFAAEAKDGGANATLWITEDRRLDFPTFVAQSMTQVESLAGSAHVVERVPAPTADDTIVRLAADAPEGQPSYEVTLRVAGPYRFYLASSVDPDASREVKDGAALVTESFTPTSAAEG
jgi:hypothetical protein